MPVKGLIFAVDQIIFSTSEDDVKRAICLLREVSSKFKFMLSILKTKVFRYIGEDSRRAEIVVNYMVLEQVNFFCYLGCDSLS